MAGYFSSHELRPTETRDIIALKIRGLIPISEPFRLAVAHSLPPEPVQCSLDEYPPIPWYDQVIGRDNDSIEARRAYALSNQLIGARP